MNKVSWCVFLLLLHGTCLFAQTKRDRDVDPIPLFGGDSFLKYFAIGINIFFIAAGVLFTLFGQRQYRVAVFTLGGVIFAGVTYVVLQEHSAEDASLWVNVGISIGLGIVGGFLFELLVFVGVFCVGALPALVLSATLLIPLHFILPTSLLQFLWCFGGAFIGGVMALIFQKTFIILGTALLGSFMTGTGIDALWLKTGFSSIVPSLISRWFSQQSNLPPLQTDPAAHTTLMVLTICMIFFFLVGAIVQFRWTSSGAMSNPTTELKNGGYEEVPLEDLEELPKH